MGVFVFIKLVAKYRINVAFWVCFTDPVRSLFFSKLEKITYNNI